MNRKKFIFISGIAGFLGSHLAEWALAKGHRVAGCDNLSVGRKTNVPTGAEFYHYDLHDLEKNRKYTQDADVIFHAAALPYDNLSLFSPYQITDHIYTITASLLSAAIENDVKRFVFCSSMSRYGNASSPFTEDVSPSPVTPYGLAKVAGENLIRTLAEVHKFEYVICVFHNIFGIRQIYNDPHRNAVSIIINQMLQDRAPLVYGDGTQTRGFSPVKDVLGLFDDLLFSKKTVGEIINIGPDREVITINQLIEKLNKIMGKALQPVYVKIRPGEVKEAVCNSDKARKLLNYCPQVSLDQSLEEMVAWIKDQGPKNFSYNQKIEINNQYTPEVWTRKVF
ncbi:MAG: NAD-dependent epimerase/dehydratase family protein [Bdellovibrionales bacterium]|nr:NAD-dependent epimerase/dehydratase family protein [Bdellovibrionales bacterium]